MKTQHVAVINGMGNGVGMQLLLKNTRGGFIGTYRAVNLRIACVVFKIGVPVKPNN